MTDFKLTGFDSFPNDGYESLERQVIDRIKYEFPEIKEFSVKFDSVLSRFNVTGLTQEQLNKIFPE
ncbi:hypothetical protein [Mucilaginibacter ginsenosidivorax]|uniref:Uncharacterized protein n=1 Tax=Mucilaginibacter ginsenosidivorax TaxID=862126 RepID=A0A5B8W4L1_9SPHI|nr:hypothetical protein [Mucilaginibacter ginsenosidivorax]QEC78357.1 hypothetical protein FSB76_21315 [Mucilaginibacter ginsenosidivorax]